MRKKNLAKMPAKAVTAVPKAIQWTCQPQGNLQELTVGEKFTLTCTGDTTGIQLAKLEIKDKDLSSEIPSLSLLESKTDSSTLQFVVTSYRTGAHKPDEIALWDGLKKIELTGFEWNVKSILKQDPSNPPQPFQAFPMWRLAYPYWFWLAMAIVLFCLIAGPYWQFSRFKKRKKQFEDLKNLDSVLNPLDSFFKEMRKIEKTLDKENFNSSEFTQEIRKNLNIFLSRSFKLPIHLWGPGQSSRQIKRKYPKVHRDYGQHLLKYFSELNNTKKEMTKKDCVFLQIEAQKIVEAMDASIEKYHGNKDDRIKK